MTKKRTTTASLPRLMALATKKLSPLEIVQEKITLVSASLDYLAKRPGGAGYITSEDPDINVQSLRFIARLGDLNDQFAAVLADETSVKPPTQDQIQAMVDAAQKLAKLTRDEAIGTATLNFLKAAFDAAQPLAKA